MLENFVLKEISHLRHEMKDLIRMTVTANTGQVSDDNEFSGVDKNLKFLLEKCRNKDKIISILSENLFERENTNVSYNFMFLAIDFFEKMATKMEVVLCVT